MPNKLTKRERARIVGRQARWIVDHRIPIVITRDRELILPDWDVFEEVQRLLTDEATPTRTPARTPTGC